MTRLLFYELHFDLKLNTNSFMLRLNISQIMIIGSF